MPRLRFPEFIADWDLVPLKHFSRFVTDRVGDSRCIPYTITSGVGLVSQDQKYGRTIAGNSLRNYIRLSNDDFAYNKSATKAYPEGYIARYVGNERAAVPNSIFTCFRIDARQVDPTYLGYLFAGNLHGRWLRRFLAIGARAHGSLNVTDSDLMALPVPIPKGAHSRVEQQRIAQCLTSLDELIAAEGQKLEALRAHKKGLVQELFPREAETTPRLRFPEFGTATLWTWKQLSCIAENLDSRRVPITEKDRTKGNTPYYGASGVVDYVAGHIFDEDLLCISEDGANLVARTSPIAFQISGKSWVNNHAHVLRFAMRATQKLVEAYLNEADLSDYITGMAQPKLNRAMLDRIPIPLPQPEEQHRIADCLDSLDVLVTRQMERLHTLKLQKQSLIQGLFPSPEGL